MLALLLAILPASGAEATPAERPARYVIVLGSNAEGVPERPALAFADDDAARFYLQAAQDAERAWLLTTFDADTARAYPELAAVARLPTREELAHALGDASWLIRASKDQGRTTELVFFFAGHGDVTPGGEGYIVLADGVFTRSELTTQIVRGSPADVNHILIDACSSYFMVSARSGSAIATGLAGHPGEAEATGVALSPALLDVVRGGRDADPAWQRTGVLVSTSTSAAVHESPEVGGGVFSYLLRSALAGAGDSDSDGRVEYAEAAAFIAASSAQIPDPRARLQVHARAPLQRPNVALVDLSNRSANRFLAVDGGGPARVRVLDARGQPWAELHREEGRPILLRLPADPFLVVRVGDQEAVLVARKAGAYALSSLRFESASAPRGASISGPFQRLFETPYGPAFLAGYLGSAPLPTPTTGPPFAVPFAAGAEPPVALPFRPAAMTAFVGAGVLTAAAAVCVGGNLLAFSKLSQQFEEGASFESSAALEVEAWRTGATITTVGAIAATLIGSGLWWAANVDEERGP
ncbi:MAG: caspase family protein [Deltaproteobacteria bacterium]|nr:caspase family protein [Deltaproteobacteria bacterium]